MSLEALQVPRRTFSKPGLRNLHLVDKINWSSDRAPRRDVYYRPLMPEP